MQVPSVTNKRNRTIIIDMYLSFRKREISVHSLVYNDLSIKIISDSNVKINKIIIDDIINKMIVILSENVLTILSLQKLFL